MEDNKLLTITGGANINGTIINAISRFINSILELGRVVGTALNRSRTNNYC